jgi:hypothetical protein
MQELEEEEEVEPEPPKKKSKAAALSNQGIAAGRDIRAYYGVIMGC